MRVPWIARTSNQSELREINPEYSLERLMLKLKLQYFGHLMQTDNSLQKSLMLGRIEGRRRRGHQRMRCLDGLTDAVDMNLGKLWAMVRDREAWHAAVHGVLKSQTDWATEQQQPRILYPARLSFRFDGEIKSFPDKQKLTELSIIKPALQQTLKELL